jgi:hypothetical protein
MGPIKMNTIKKTVLSIFMVFFMSNILIAQEDVQQDSISTEKPVKEKKEKKAKSSFKIYAGATLNDLNVSTETYESGSRIGYMFGASYKRGRFFYYEIGARYNQRMYDLNPLGPAPSPASSEDDEYLSISSLDIPLTGGINVTSAIDRLFGLRFFISAIPAFTLGVNDNTLGITKDDVNGFNFNGQAGIGIDITVIFIEAGFVYGFGDTIKSDVQSNQQQGFVNLGFRF